MKGIILTSQNFIKKVEKAGYPVKAAFLFGSYAKGKAREHSDIDICIVSPSFGKNYFNEMVTLKNISSDIDLRIEPIPMALDDLDDKYSTLASEIKKYGISLI